MSPRGAQDDDRSRFSRRITRSSACRESVPRGSLERLRGVVGVGLMKRKYNMLWRGLHPRGDAVARDRDAGGAAREGDGRAPGQGGGRGAVAGSACDPKRAKGTFLFTARP